MKIQLFKLLLVVLTLCLLASCAPDVEITSTFNWTEFKYEDGITIYGFGSGLLHGLLIPIELVSAFCIWLFDLDWNVGMWADLNNGIRYWLGYIIGGCVWILIITYYVPKTKKVLVGKKESTFFFFFSSYENKYKNIPLAKGIVCRNILIASSFVWLTFLAALLYNTVLSPDIPALNRTQVMNVISNKSLKDGAYYYIQRRDKYDFFDELYCDSIVPVILEGNFLDLKNVYDIVKDTPAGEILGPWYKEGKEIFKEEIYNKLDSLTSESKTFFKEEMPSYLSLAIDSILEEETHKIVEGYCGGVMNYRKLSLLFERDKNFARFDDYTKKILSASDYEKCITSYCNAYIASVTNMQNDYLYEISDKQIMDTKIEYPKLTISDDVSGLRSQLELLTDEECDEVVVDIFKDGVIPVALFFATGGASAIVEGVYDAGTLVYDVAKVYNDIQNNRLSFNEKLELYLAQHLQSRLEAFYPLLENSAFKAIEEHNIAVKREIENVL